jgi:hypothetical protein
MRGMGAVLAMYSQAGGATEKEARELKKRLKQVRKDIKSSKQDKDKKKKLKMEKKMIKQEYKAKKEQMKQLLHGLSKMTSDIAKKLGKKTHGYKEKEEYKEEYLSPTWSISSGGGIDLIKKYNISKEDRLLLLQRDIDTISKYGMQNEDFYKDVPKIIDQIERLPRLFSEIREFGKELKERDIQQAKKIGEKMEEVMSKKKKRFGLF